MWELDLSWPSELNEMTLAAWLLACAHHIRAYQAAPKGPDRSWKRKEAQDALVLLGQQEEALPVGRLAELADKLQIFRETLVDLPERLLAAVEQESKAVLLADLEAAPTTAEEYRQRRNALEGLDWLGGHASSIPRGWVSLFEKIARLLGESAGDPESERWETDELKEKYGTLRWYVLGDKLFEQAAFLTEEMSEFCCLACGREATIDDSGWLLNLCEEHKKLRLSAPLELSELMYAT